MLDGKYKFVLVVELIILMKIAIHDDCLKLFNVLKYEKTAAGHRYIIFKIDKEQVVSAH